MFRYWLLFCIVMWGGIVQASEHLFTLPMNSLCTHMQAAFGDTFKQLPHLVNKYDLSEQDRKKLISNESTEKLADKISIGICARSLQKFRELAEHDRKNNEALLKVLTSALAQEIEHRLAASATSP